MASEAYRGSSGASKMFSESRTTRRTPKEAGEFTMTKMDQVSGCALDVRSLSRK